MISIHVSKSDNHCRALFMFLATCRLTRIIYEYANLSVIFRSELMSFGNAFEYVDLIRIE